MAVLATDVLTAIAFRRERPAKNELKSARVMQFTMELRYRLRHLASFGSEADHADANSTKCAAKARTNGRLEASSPRSRWCTDPRSTPSAPTPSIRSSVAS